MFNLSVNNLTVISRHKYEEKINSPVLYVKTWISLSCLFREICLVLKLEKLLEIDIHFTKNSLKICFLFYT